MSNELIEQTEDGLYCAEGGFHLDPEGDVDRAVISHGHADHGATTSAETHCTSSTASVLTHRYGTESVKHDFGEFFSLGDTTVSLHPAGHVLGSAVVLVEHDGERWLYTGDFKDADDPTCKGFEPVPCDVLITESTFALPVYQWRDADRVFDDLADWVSESKSTKFIYAYSLGKAQRVLFEVGRRGMTDVKVHSSVKAMNEVYRSEGVSLPVFDQADLRTSDWHGDVIVAPQGVDDSKAVRKHGDKRTAMVSGWMRVRGKRRWKNYDRGFSVSDHCDWHGLLDTVRRCDPEKVFTVHGYADELAKHLRSQGLDAESLV